jgi:hypothetical protein
MTKTRWSLDTEIKNKHNLDTQLFSTFADITKSQIIRTLICIYCLLFYYWLHKYYFIMFLLCFLLIPICNAFESEQK